MGRGDKGGTKDEFSGKLPVRYSPNGGGSAQRFWGAVASIDAWHLVFQRCEFTCDDAFDVLDKTHDSDKVSVYSDCPWPDAGDGYTHDFDEAAQRRLAAKLATFERARVVVRFGDHPLIRELYPESHWRWIRYPNRGQGNGAFGEVLLVNGAPVSAVTG
jgi:DNA adenine methylase